MVLQRVLASTLVMVIFHSIVLEEIIFVFNTDFSLIFDFSIRRAGDLHLHNKDM